MAKAKAKKSGKSVPKWSPTEKGETVTGKFVQFQAVEAGLVMILDTAALNVGTVIRQLLAPVHQSIRPGDTFSWTFDGMSGRTKLFSGKLNGKELQREFTPLDPATKADVENFFSDEWEFPAKK